MLKELDRAHQIGVDIVQIDDGWQLGITANSGCKSGGVYTLVNNNVAKPDWMMPLESRLSNCVCIQEDLTNGQSVESFSVYGYLPEYRHKKILLFEGKTIGHKVLCKFSPLRASKYEVVINEHSGDYTIKDIKVFYVK